jgi:hypothetical protein
MRISVYDCRQTNQQFEIFNQEFETLKNFMIPGRQDRNRYWAISID